MDAQKVNQFLFSNADNLPAEKMSYIKEQLLALDDSRQDAIMFMEFKKPTIMLVISLLLGDIGVDRFILGDIGIGVGKLLTFWLFIWWFIDLFLIMKATKEHNFKKLQQVITFG